MPEGNLGTSLVEHEPPGVASHSRDTDIDSDDHVTEEQPLADKRLAAVTWGYTHNAVVRGVEAESGSRERVGDEVDPEELHGDKSLGHTQEDRQEDGDDFTNVGRDCANGLAEVLITEVKTRTEVTDELLRVVVDQTTLLDSQLNCCEVRIGQDHISCELGNVRTAAHRDTDVGLLEGGSIVYTITRLDRATQYTIDGIAFSETYHGHDKTLALKEVHELTLVSGFGTAE